MAIAGWFKQEKFTKICELFHYKFNFIKEDAKRERRILRRVKLARA